MCGGGEKKGMFGAEKGLSGAKKIGQLTQSMGPERVEVCILTQRATIPGMRV
jgi:hypothetical protein